jgi:anti-sigma B factor antagonist
MIEWPAPAPELADTAQHTPITSTGNGRRPLVDVTLRGTVLGNYTAPYAELSMRLDQAERRISLRGEFDAATAPLLADVVAILPETDPGDFTIDLAGVRFIDAGGLGCLVGFANQLAAGGAKLRVVGASARLRRVFDLAQLGGLLRAS